MKKTLVEEIQDFQKTKKRLVPVLISLGLLGIVLPVLPGLVFLFLGFALLFPRKGEQMISRFRRRLNLS